MIWSSYIQDVHVDKRNLDLGGGKKGVVNRVVTKFDRYHEWC